LQDLPLPTGFQVLAHQIVHLGGSRGVEVPAPTPPTYPGSWDHMGVRIVPGQDPKAVLAALKKHLLKNAPWGVEVSFSNESASPAWTTDTGAPAFAAARKALQKGYGRPAVDMGCGGSIPFVGPFAKALKGAPPCSSASRTHCRTRTLRTKACTWPCSPRPSPRRPISTARLPR
jgi:hypothetical protein